MIRIAQVTFYTWPLSQEPVIAELSDPVTSTALRSAHADGHAGADVIVRQSARNVPAAPEFSL